VAKAATEQRSIDGDVPSSIGLLPYSYHQDQNELVTHILPNIEGKSVSSPNDERIAILKPGSRKSVMTETEKLSQRATRFGLLTPHRGY